MSCHFCDETASLMRGELDLDAMMADMPTRPDGWEETLCDKCKTIGEEWAFIKIGELKK